MEVKKITGAKMLWIFGIQSILGTSEEFLWAVNNASTRLQQTKLTVSVPRATVDQASLTVCLMLAEVMYQKLFY